MSFGKWVKQRFAKPHKASNVRFGQNIVKGIGIGAATLAVPGVAPLVGRTALAAEHLVIGGASAASRGIVAGGKYLGSNIAKGFIVKKAQGIVMPGRNTDGTVDTRGWGDVADTSTDTPAPKTALDWNALFNRFAAPSQDVAPDNGTPGPSPVDAPSGQSVTRDYGNLILVGGVVLLVILLK